MIYNLKMYQRDAVEELKNYFKLYLNKPGKTIVFKAPTGSGKTFIASSLIEELALEYADFNFCVIWASIGKGELQKQSYNSVRTYLGGNPICSLLEDTFFGSRTYIRKHEIVFVNWEKLVSRDKETGKWINGLMKDQEGENFIDVIDQTKKNGTKILLIVDESHIGANSSSRIAEFKENIIVPDITLEMSATPLSKVDVEVKPQNVIDEGMIKEDVIVNEGISKNDRSLRDKDSELLVMEKAEEKRNELKKAYEEIQSNVNPLVLVQIPNVVEGEAKKLVVKDFLRENGITEENHKLKLWCDNESGFDKKAIKRPDDETEYLIFKTAVATGWDCPRAQILVKFREGKSETFEIQTIGRILRTAEAKSYNNPLLDNAYIFTNIEEFETKQDSYNPNRIKTESSFFRKPETKLSVWEQTHLESYYRSREEDYNSADSRFNSYFETEFMHFFGLNKQDKYLIGDANVSKLEAKGINLDIKTNDNLIEETSIASSTLDKEQNISGGSVTVKMAENDVQATYYSIIFANLNGLAYIRSKSPINTAIIDVFSKFYNMFDRSTKISAIQKIVVNNHKVFSEILSSATYKFRELLQENAGKKGKYYDFKIEDKRSYSAETHKEITCNKSLYQPLYVLMTNPTTGSINNLEKDFINFLDTSTFVKWLWENGPELMQINFGIPYNNGMNTFQPDFIIKFVNGDVGIFDTKGIDQRVEDTKTKEEALYKYLEKINCNRCSAPTIIGGIVVQKGTQFYYYCEAEYHDFAEDSSKWKNFNDILRKVACDLNLGKYL